MKSKLTDRYLRNLNPPESDRLEISDTQRKGLRIRISPTGSKVWMFEKRVKGGPKRKHTIGTWPAVSLAEAREIALEIEAEARRGVDRVALEQERRQEAEAAKAGLSTIREVIDLYAELHLSQLRTGNERRRQVEAALSSKLGLPITSLTHKDIQSAIDEKLRDGHHVAANRVRAALLAFANWAWVRGYLAEPIGLRIAKPTKETARERVLSLEEVKAIYYNAAELGPLWGPLVRLLLLTGQRRGEIVGLKWNEIDLEAARIIKTGAATKNRKAHITHLSAPALELLGGLERGESDYVFTTTGRSPASGFSRMKRQLDRLLGEEFEPWRLHDIRTAMATALAEAGEPEAIVDRILNHAASGSAPSAVARVYNQAEQLPQRAKALDRWAEMVTGQSAKLVKISR
jgi:integrase